MATEAAYVDLTEGSAPATPGTGIVRVYVKTDGSAYQKDDAGTETGLAGGGGGAVATDTIWDAAGDMVQGTGANTAARTAIGAAGTVWRSTGTAGAWSAEAGRLIGLTMYGGAGSYTTTTSAADADATNLVVAFTVPSTGKVLVRLTCQAYSSAGSGAMQWGLREGSSVVDGMHQVMADTETNGVHTISRTFYVSGLTPGDAKSYKWGAKHVTNSFVMRWDSADAGNGWASMEVYVAP